MILGQIIISLAYFNLGAASSGGEYAHTTSDYQSVVNNEATGPDVLSSILHARDGDASTRSVSMLEGTAANDANGSSSPTYPPTGGNASRACGNRLSPIPLFLWTEVPKDELGVSHTNWEAFYTSMLNYILGNCINANTTHVILRVIHPNFPVADPMWSNIYASPMFTHFISKLPAGIQLRLYPYLGGRSSPASWAAQSVLSDPLDGVFQFAVSWNARLAAMNYTSVFSGIVFDLEEDYPWNWTHVAEVKANYTPLIASVGVSIGFDEIVKLKQLAPFVDEFYMQMYDFYTRETQHITSNISTSPFVEYPDNPMVIAEWLKTEVLTDPDLFAIYRRYRKNINIMWSTQNKGSSECIYPLRGTCGSHYEFGLFNPNAFNRFMQIVTSPREFPLFQGVTGHGLFQFDLIRKDWVHE